MAQQSKPKALLFHSIIYWIGVVLSKLASFILVPIFTHHLTPADYGALELITTTTGVLALLVGGRITSALFRFYHVAETDPEKNAVVSTALLLGLATSGLAGVALYLAAPAIADLVLSSADKAYLFQIIFLSMLLGLVQELALAYLRIKERSILFVCVNLARVVAMLALNTLFIAYFHMGVLGALLGPAVVSVVFTPFIVGTVLRRTGLRLDRTLAVRLMRYSAPLVPAALATFVVHFGDRYILREFGGLEELGIYAVAYKFGMLISALIGQPFSLIWGNRLHSYYWNPDRDALYNQTLSGLSFTLCGAAVALSLFIDEALLLMTPAAYWPASQLVPVLAGGYVLFVLNAISSAPLQSEGKTVSIAVFTILIAVISIGLNLLLIPFLGAMGAAIATALSFGLMLVWSRLASMRISSLRLEHDRAWKPMLAALAVVVVGRAVTIDGLWSSLAFKTLLLATYPLLLVPLRFLRPDEWDGLKTQLIPVLHRLRRSRA